MNSETKSYEMNDLRSRAEDIVRECPGASAGVALGVGFLMALLPIGSILVALIRLAFHLFKPALLVLGLVKLVEACGNCACGNDQD